MKKHLRTILIFILMATLVFQFPLVIQAEDMVKAKIQGIKGDVFVKKGGGQREFAAFENMQVTQGDWVRTGVDSSAKIVYEDGNQTVIDANTKINIQRLTSSPKGKETSVKLFAGGVWSKIKKMLNIGDSYEVETPTAVMGVRGTLYLVSVDENGQVSVDVLEGAVAAGANNDPAGGGTSFLVGTGSSLNVGASGQTGAQAPIDIATLVESVSPSVLVDIVNDIVERAQDIEQQTQQALNQTQNQQTALQALQMATQVTELTSLAQQVVQTVQQSTNTQLTQQFQQTLQNNNQSMQTLVQSIQQQSQNAQNVNQQAQQKAEEQGLTQEVIQQTVDNIVNASVASQGTNPTGGGNEGGNNTGSSNPTDQTFGGDDFGPSGATGNATAAITSPTANANNYVNALSSITGEAQDSDGGTISAVQLSIKKSGAGEYLQNDGSWSATEYWFNATTSNAYATWTYDLTSQQKAGVEASGTAGITLNVKVNDGAVNTLNGLTSFTLDTVKPAAKAGAAGCATVQDGVNAAVYDAGDKILLTFSEPVKVSTLMPNSTDLSKLSLTTGAGWGSSPAIQALSEVDGFTDSFEITLGTSPTIAADGSQTITVAIGAAEDKAENKNTAQLTFDIPCLPIAPISGNATGTITSPADNSWINGINGMPAIAGTASDPYGDNIAAVHVAVKKGSTASYLQNDGSWGSTICWLSTITSNGFSDWNYSLSSVQQNGIKESGETELKLSLKVDDGQPNELSNILTINLDFDQPAVSLITVDHTGGSSTSAYDAGDIISLTFSEPIKTSTLFASAMDLSKLVVTGGGTLTGSSIAAVSAIDGFTSMVNITLGSSANIAADGSQDIQVISGAAEDKAGNTNSTDLTFNMPPLTISEFAFRLQINSIASGATSITGITMPGWYVRIKKYSHSGWTDWGELVQAGQDGSFTVANSMGALSSGTRIGVYVGSTSALDPALDNELGEYYLSVGSSGGGLTVNKAYASPAEITGYGLAHSFLVVDKQDWLGTAFSASDGTFTINYSPAQSAGTVLNIMVMNFSQSFTFGMCKITLLPTPS